MAILLGVARLPMGFAKLHNKVQATPILCLVVSFPSLPDDLGDAPLLDSIPFQTGGAKRIEGCLMCCGRFYLLGCLHNVPQYTATQPDTCSRYYHSKLWSLDGL